MEGVKTSKEFQSARDKIADIYGKVKKGDAPIRPQALIRELEQIFRIKKEEWPIELLRSLWDELQTGLTKCSRSIEHESVWLQFSGFVLRPGYGYPNDNMRISEAWRFFQIGVSHRKELKVLLQWCIFWRRISGGLDQGQQELVFDAIKKEELKNKAISFEAYRTLSSLELVPIEKKVKLAQELSRELSRGKIEEAVAWSFGRLCSRALSNSAAQVLPAEIVEKSFEKMKAISWKDPRYQALAKAFIQAGRFIDREDLDLKEEVRLELQQKIKECNLPPHYSRLFRDFIPFEKNDLASLLGEELPIGLELVE